jgi:hypothetical protein
MGTQSGKSVGIGTRAMLTTLTVLSLCAANVSRAQGGFESAAGLVGTWTLSAGERDVASGQPARVRGAHGLLVIDAVGHVFEFFEAPMPAGDGASLTERQKAFADFGGFWGEYEVPEPGRIDFQAEAGVSPNVRGISFSRRYTLDDDTLVITSSDEPQAQRDMRWTWVRVPMVESLSPTYRQVVGFWRHVDERRVNLATGEIQSIRQRGPSIIVYTPAGYFGVHFPVPDRARFAADVPTADEAQAAFSGYIGYFGALGVYPGEVAHNVMAGTQPSAGAILRRFAEVEGDEAVLTIPTGRAASGDAAQFVTTVNMRRLSGLEELLPR